MRGIWDSKGASSVKVSKSFAYGLMVLAAVMWATSGTFTTLATDSGATTMEVTVFSTVFTALVLLPLIAMLDKQSLAIGRRDLMPLFIFAQITGTFFALGWYYCVDLTGVATAVILLYAYPMIVTIASVFLLSEKLTREKALALPLTFIGAVLVVGARDLEEGFRFDMIGVLLGIYTALAGAFYYIYGKKFLDKYSANTIVVYMTLFSIPILVIIAIITNILVANPDTHAGLTMSGSAWAYVFLIGLLPGAVGPIVSLFALKHIQASRASIIASVEPVAAVIIAYLVLSETLSVLQGIGVGLVFLGVLMLRLRAEPEQKPEAVALER
jgi:DME family drug/metabolite transporter